jgi:Domain of unknown function (DUF4234)
VGHLSAAGGRCDGGAAPLHTFFLGAAMSEPSVHTAAASPAPPAAMPAAAMPAAASSAPVGKLRNPVVVGVLTFVTLGIYSIAWWYLVNSEMAEHGRARGRHDLGDDPALSTLAFFPGALVVVPAVWTTVTTFQRIQVAQRLHRQVPVNGWLGLVLGLVLSPALFAYMQSGLNSAWTAAAAEGSGSA